MYLIVIDILITTLCCFYITFTLSCILFYVTLCIYVNRLCCWIEHQIKVIYSAVRLGHAECVGGGETNCCFTSFFSNVMTCLYSFNWNNLPIILFSIQFFFLVVCVCVAFCFQSSSADNTDCRHTCCPWRFDPLSHETSGWKTRWNGGEWICKAKTLLFLSYLDFWHFELLSLKWMGKNWWLKIGFIRFRWNIVWTKKDTKRPTSILHKNSTQYVLHTNHHIITYCFSSYYTQQFNILLPFYTVSKLYNTCTNQTAILD